jgi:hypothetical protein
MLQFSYIRHKMCNSRKHFLFILFIYNSFSLLYFYLQLINFFFFPSSLYLLLLRFYYPPFVSKIKIDNLVTQRGCSRTRFVNWTLSKTWIFNWQFSNFPPFFLFVVSPFFVDSSKCFFIEKLSKGNVFSLFLHIMFKLFIFQQASKQSSNQDISY